MLKREWLSRCSGAILPNEKLRNCGSRTCGGKREILIPKGSVPSLGPTIALGTGNLFPATSRRPEREFNRPVSFRGYVDGVLPALPQIPL